MERERVIVELGVPEVLPLEKTNEYASRLIKVKGFAIDLEYTVSPVPPSDEKIRKSLQKEGKEARVIRGIVTKDQRIAIEKHPLVISVFSDSRIESFDG